MAGIIIAAVGLLGLAMASDAINPDRPDSRLQAQSYKTPISYKLDWDWGWAGSNKNGLGWSVTNDLGHRIMVRRGYLVTVPYLATTQ